MKVTGGCSRYINLFTVYSVCLFIFVQRTHSINLGLVAGDVKRAGGPLVIRKVSHNSPIIININPGLPKTPGRAALPPKPLPKLPAKPPPLSSGLRLNRRTTRSPLPPILPVFSTSFLAPPTLFPPHVPLFPTMPSVIPPLLPIMPSPLIKTPRLRRLPLVRPLQVPILGRTPLEKAISNVKLAGPLEAARRNVLRNLLDLRRKGSLTTPEFYRFKRLLLQ